MDAADQLLWDVEARRKAASRELPAKQRASLGQFFTPLPAARFLAELIELPREGRFRLLDPGAGVGSLSAAVVSRVINERPNVALDITAFEVDPSLAVRLTATLEQCVAVAAESGTRVTFTARFDNFIEYASGWLFEQPGEFDAVIANPPYKKVNTTAPERVAAGSRGLRASNLYTIFTALAADLIVEGGQMSVIIPRSWANGPYHEPFRRFLLDRMSLDFIHVYEMRGKVFADAEVLQENVVLHGVREAQARVITLSSSSGGENPRVEREVPLQEVLHPNDPHLFVRIPANERITRIAEQMTALPASLADLDVKVSTGRVVDFRARESLRQDPAEGTVPLIYPGHIRAGRIVWPASGSKKPNALHLSPDTESLVLPNESYVLVKRFSAKEERRRVAAAVSGPQDVPGSVVAFENHLNVYHRDGRGLPLLLAFGLSGYLNCTLVDDYVRSFSGHTQINATDLRQLRYPSASDLTRLGGALSAAAWPRSQDDLDATVSEYIPAVAEPLAELEVA